MNHTRRMMITTQEQPHPQPWILPAADWNWYTASARLAALARSFTPITLKQMDAVALLNRTDVKFVLTTGQLLDALASLQGDYRILSVNGCRLNHYRTLYFDTPDFELYHLHVNERADRYKVRSREYTDSHTSFLEVKHKTPKDRTIKERIPTAKPVVKMTPEAENWLYTILPYKGRALEPKLWNTFTRVTLVSVHYCERVTLDVDLNFYTGEKVARLDNVAIAEVKMDAANRVSPFLAQMRAQRIHPLGFSKYCIGVSLLYDRVKKNTLKRKILLIEKMTGEMYHEQPE
jgi:hypothetical protein